jgi:hypothetical protein
MLGYVTKPCNSTPKALEIPGILSWNNNSEQPQMVFSCYSANFNLKRNILIRSITPYGVSDSLNISVDDYLTAQQLCKAASG